jgi:hypothetical protein
MLVRDIIARNRFQIVRNLKGLSVNEIENALMLDDAANILAV